MRLLILDAGGNALDLVLRAKAAGHDVRMYIPDKPRLGLIARGLVQRVSDWRPWVRWADLIFLSDNTAYLAELRAAIRASGANPAVFGATEASSEWELDRDKGMKLFKAKGIDVPPSREFKDYDAAIAYVKKEDRPFVSKPSGDADKALSYVAKSPEDLVFMLQRWKRLQKLKAPFILQEKINGTEMAVGGWIGPLGFAPGWCENFEFKKLMDGDRGVACFTGDSEVLTKDGWKFWTDVSENDLFCTLEGDTIAYRPPLRMVKQPFAGNLVGWKSLTVDILVTPGHQMRVQDDHYRQPFFFEPADITINHRRMVEKTGGIAAAENDCSPEYAALIGAYVADGHCHKDRSVVFGNCPKHKQIAFTQIAREAGFSAIMYGRDLYINNADLVREVSPLGKAHQKRVPKEIKFGSQAAIAAFFQGYLAGDGSCKGEGINVCAETVSRGLADDIMEMGLKIGIAVSINVRDRREEPGHEVYGVICVNKQIVYGMSFTKKRTAMLKPENSYRQPYEGTVYCVEVPSHVIYVRRNGKACWIGQTGEQGTILRYVTKSKLADLVLKPFVAEIVKTGHTGYIDVNCIIDDEGTPWPLEWTCRPGWPTFNIQQAVHTGDPVTWMHDLARGLTPEHMVLDTVAAGVVLSIPDYPYNKYPLGDVAEIPIYCIRAAKSENLHFCEMALGAAPMKVGNTVVDDQPIMVTAGTYVLVASGTGSDVEEARRHAYQTMDSVSLPNSPMFRGDIGRRLQHQLPTLHEHGFATGLTYKEE